MNDKLAAAVLAQAKDCGLSIVTAESCTGGLIAAAFSRAPGAATHFHGGFVTYTKPMKTAVLGVSSDLLERKGAVCEEVARAMAQGALEGSPAEIALSITGVAGPEPDEDGNPGGLIYCAVARRDRTKAIRIMSEKKTRETILDDGIEQALRLLETFCQRPQTVVSASR